MPGHQGLPDPVLAFGDAVAQLEKLPDDQQCHQPVECSRNRAIATSGVDRRVRVRSGSGRLARFGLPVDLQALFSRHARQVIGHNLLQLLRLVLIG